MLKPIHRVNCSPALEACQRLMQRFALWLCNPMTTGAKISQQGLQPPVLASAIEANWLWDFLQRIDRGQSLLSRAQMVANMAPPHKANLANWMQTVAAVATQFQPAAVPWPINRSIATDSDWKAFKALMEAFYEKGLRGGLPYLPNGAYFGDRDRPFRRIVTAAQRAVLRVEILMHAVTMERFFRARQRQVGASPYAGMTAAGRVLPGVTVRDFSALATCYADSTGRNRPKTALHL